MRAPGTQATGVMKEAVQEQKPMDGAVVVSWVREAGKVQMVGSGQDEVWVVKAIRHWVVAWVQRTSEISCYCCFRSSCKDTGHPATAAVAVAVAG